MVQWEENLLKPLTCVTYDIRNSIFNQWYMARFSIDNNLDCSAKQNMSLESKGTLIFLTEAINILIQSAFLRKIWWECAKLSKKYESLCVDLSVLVYFYLQEIYQLQIKTNSPKQFIIWQYFLNICCSVTDIRGKNRFGICSFQCFWCIFSTTDNLFLCFKIN